MLNCFSALRIDEVFVCLFQEVFDGILVKKAVKMK